MAANRQQGTALAVLLVGFTALPAGLVTRTNHPTIGTLAALIGGALMVGSLLQGYRIKRLEFAEDNEGGN